MGVPKKPNPGAYLNDRPTPPCAVCGKPEREHHFKDGGVCGSELHRPTPPEPPREPYTCPSCGSSDVYVSRRFTGWPDVRCVKCDCYVGEWD